MNMINSINVGAVGSIEYFNDLRVTPESSVSGGNTLVSVYKPFNSYKLDLSDNTILPELTIEDKFTAHNAEVLNQLTVSTADNTIADGESISYNSNIGPLRFLGGYTYGAGFANYPYYYKYYINSISTSNTYEFTNPAESLLGGERTKGSVASWKKI